jgi:hypothetical protein
MHPHMHVHVWVHVQPGLAESHSTTIVLNLYMPSCLPLSSAGPTGRRGEIVFLILRPLKLGVNARHDGDRSDGASYYSERRQTVVTRSELLLHTERASYYFCTHGATTNCLSGTRVVKYQLPHPTALALVLMLVSTSTSDTKY